MTFQFIDFDAQTYRRGGRAIQIIFEKIFENFFFNVNWRTFHFSHFDRISAGINIVLKNFNLLFVNSWLRFYNSMTFQFIDFDAQTYRRGGRAIQIIFEKIFENFFFNVNWRTFHLSHFDRISAGINIVLKNFNLLFGKLMTAFL